MPLCSPGPPGVSAKLSWPWDGSSVAQPRPSPSRSHRRVTQAGKDEFCVLLNTLKSDIPKSRCISFSVTEDLFEHPNCSDSFKMNTELRGGGCQLRLTLPLTQRRPSQCELQDVFTLAFLFSLLF